NYIGISDNDEYVFPNHANGVELNTSNNTVGGLTAAERNVISGNAHQGVKIGGHSQGNQLFNNYIGMDVPGTTPQGNGENGVLILSNGNVVGGVARSTGNLISGNQLDGVRIAWATDNYVQSNTIGPDASGWGLVAPQQNGVHLLGADGNVI